MEKRDEALNLRTCPFLAAGVFADRGARGPYPTPGNEEMFMAAAYIEHRPLASDPHAGTAHHAVVFNGKEILDFKTQREAAEWAKAQGYKPVHVARERHLQA